MAYLFRLVSVILIALFTLNRGELKPSVSTNFVFFGVYQVTFPKEASIELGLSYGLSLWGDGTEPRKSK